MSFYVISVSLEGGGKGYLHPNGDGLSFVIKDNIVGAALWKTYHKALAIKISTVGDSGKVELFFC